MLAPLSWLCDYAAFDHPVEVLATQLSDLGLVVEGVERIGEDLPDVVVARILDIRPHPDADRIRLVDVDAGDGEPLQIACGANNMAVGDLVPLAKVGAILPGGMEIARRKMRGEWSNGMLCAPGEIGLHQPEGEVGLLILDPGLAPAGTPIADALGGADVVFDLEVSPNRPDALSIAGVSRDLAAALGLPWAWPTTVPTAAGAAAVASPAVDASIPRASISVEAPDLCARFTGTVLTGVRVDASPAWLARRLTLAGMRPINTVVDVSNYVMVDTGQPNHAYDLDRLGDRGLIVRRATEGETLVTLDGVTQTFVGDDLLICDAASVPVGVAGVMGGGSSEISESTTSVLLEAAWFDPATVARTGIRLGLTSEARYRFERGVDPELAPRAVERFAQLLAACGPADHADHAGPAGHGDLRLGPTVDVRSDGDLPAPAVVTLRTARVNAVLGTDLDDATVEGLLAPIGFEADLTSVGVHTVTVPSWRPDTTREIDVIEEVARHHGYPRIARRMPAGARIGGLTPYQSERRRVRDVLVGTGLDEAWTTTFLGPGDLERAGQGGDAVVVANPLDQSESVLRTTLLPGLLKAVRFNVDRQQPDVTLFEIGRIFERPGEGEALPHEREQLAAILAGSGADARTATRLWAVLAGALNLAAVKLIGDEIAGLHPTRAARVVGADGAVLGAVGEVDPDVVAAYGLTRRVGYLEVSLEGLLSEPRHPRQAHPISRYPASDVDLAFVVPEAIPARDVVDLLRQAGGELLEHVELFDVFRGERLGADRRSLALRLRFRALDRTLADTELAAIRQAAIDAVVAAGAELRS